MLTHYLLYSALSSGIALPLIEAIRIHFEKKPNVNHSISWLLGFIAAVACYVLSYGWHIIWVIIPAAVIAVGMRVVLYDGSLNIATRYPYDRVSTTTNAKTDNAWNKLGFWQRRLVGLGIVGVGLLLNWLLL